MNLQLETLWAGYSNCLSPTPDDCQVRPLFATLYEPRQLGQPKRLQMSNPGSRQGSPERFSFRSFKS